MTDRAAIWNEAMEAPNLYRLLEEVNRPDTLPVFHHPCGCREVRHPWLRPHDWRECQRHVVIGPNGWEISIRARKIGEG